MGLFFLCVGGGKKNLCHRCCVNLPSWWELLLGMGGHQAGPGRAEGLLCFGTLYCSVIPAAHHIH